MSADYPAYEAAKASAAYVERFGLGSSSGGPMASSPAVAAATQHSIPTAPSSATDVEERLLANYLMARFNSSALVCVCGTQWQLLAERHGADHPSALMVDHLYRMGLDAMPPNTARIKTKYLPRFPPSLRSMAYPEYVHAKMQRKQARRGGASGSSASNLRVVSTMASLKSKLYNAPLAAPFEPSKTYTIQRDRHLAR